MVVIIREEEANELQGQGLDGPNTQLFLPFQRFGDRAAAGKIHKGRNTEQPALTFPESLLLGGARQWPVGTTGVLTCIRTPGIASDSQFVELLAPIIRISISDPGTEV